MYRIQAACSLAHLLKLRNNDDDGPVRDCIVSATTMEIDAAISMDIITELFETSCTEFPSRDFQIVLEQRHFEPGVVDPESVVPPRAVAVWKTLRTRPMKGRSALTVEEQPALRTRFQQLRGQL